MSSSKAVPPCRYIQQMLGHSPLQTTMVYLKVSPEALKKVPSPLDHLALGGLTSCAWAMGDRPPELADIPDHVGMLYRQALILERKGDRVGAVASAEHSMAAAAEAPGELRDEYTRLDTALLERRCQP